jgi:hypothetical protein
MLNRENLSKLYPELPVPTRCENGCGAVCAVGEMFRSYQKDSNGDPKLICQCCASEIGHLDEDDEEHEDAPICKRPSKRQR